MLYVPSQSEEFLVWFCCFTVIVVVTVIFAITEQVDTVREDQRVGYGVAVLALGIGVQSRSGAPAPASRVSTSPGRQTRARSQPASTTCRLSA